MTLNLTREGATAVLTMNRPAQRNALSPDLRAAFLDAFQSIRDDDAVKAVVLTGSGGHFCAGGDIKAMAQAREQGADAFSGRQRLLKMQRWFDMLVDLEKPVITAIEGSAFGAGLSLALAGDYAMAAPSATFCAVFARIGYVPDLLGMYLLPRAVGLARAKEMVFTARVCNAEEALAMGLIQEICEGDVVEAALARAARFHAAPTQAIGLAKTIMNRAYESDREAVYAKEAMAQALCGQSGYHQEAARRFIEKQPPVYNWK
ncbi:enoyl-CoA hydratase/isomerase family protein [Allopusillimonas soli]|uniref:Enoyl-CoA hydratase/isomerase family protein n=1 Tax=Allopusillimonas soli TaxID=659016 RepID=A0A853F7Q9_9BURK|nr:enoyl-CoA hydratase/isomerase family protein [Allopusillimonas soli]NYT36009.1 enoyl-CoA hydratase/isomerase family protein [Allopusillimonas soli]TEA76353.1 enoyl-CoA hydratase/isomerase family protein [Allopusillimonas soli]